MPEPRVRWCSPSQYSVHHCKYNDCGSVCHKYDRILIQPKGKFVSARCAACLEVSPDALPAQR